MMEPVLSLQIDLPAKGSGQTLRSLHQQLKAAIADGRLAGGAALPSTRALAESLRIARNTAIAAYDLLVSEGYAVTRPGGGTFVALDVRRSAGRKPKDSTGPDTRLNPFWRGAARANATQQSACRFDFRPGLPDKSHFPFAIWRRLSARALRSLSRVPAAYADAQGRPALRQAIARHISFARAVACAAGDVVVTAGAQQAFDLLARILVTQGRTVVAVEEPGYAPLRSAFAAAGARLASVPVDSEGIIVERLSPSARVICVTPSHQFPLGCAMSLRRRLALLEFARSNEALVVEDDYDGEFRFGGRTLDALQSLDRDDLVFYVGTFSKSLFPALRLGFVVAPPWAKQALVAARKLCDWHGAVLAQDTLAAFIDEGHLARHVRKMRRVYAERHALVLSRLERDFGAWLQVIPNAAGLHISATASRHITMKAIVESARASDVGIYSIRSCCSQRPTRDGLMSAMAASGRARSSRRCRDCKQSFHRRLLREPKRSDLVLVSASGRR